MPAAMRSRDMEIPPGFFPDRSKLSAVARLRVGEQLGVYRRPIHDWWLVDLPQDDPGRPREDPGGARDYAACAAGILCLLDHQPDAGDAPPFCAWVVSGILTDFPDLLRCLLNRKLRKDVRRAARRARTQARRPRREPKGSVRGRGQKPQTSIWAILRGTSPATEMTRVLLMHRLHDRLFSLPVSRGARDAQNQQPVHRVVCRSWRGHRVLLPTDRLLHEETIYA